MSILGDTTRRSAAVAVALAVIASALVAGVGPGIASQSGGTPAETADPAQASTNATTLSGTTDLSDADVQLNGSDAGDRAGWSVAAGDVNGDGVSDLLVGAQTNDSGGNNSGAAYLFYGPVDAANASLSDADAVFAGAGAGDRAGWSVSAGDLNGDGFADIAVGAPLNDSVAPSAGAAYVIYGNDSLSSRSLANADATLAGEGLADRAGWSVDVVANATAEGAAGLLVGAPLNDSGAGNGGAAYLVSGAEAPAGTVSLSDAAATWTGVGSGDRAGYAVGGGDLNGDGTAELLIGAPYNSSAGNASGAVYAVSAGEADGAASLADAAATWTGEAADDRAGFSVAAAGDVDGDGFGDVAVGAPYSDIGGNDSGAAYVASGGEELTGSNLSDASRRLAGGGAGDNAGWSVASAGNATCDEYADLLVGAPGNDTGGDDAGAAYVVAGGTDTANLTDAAATLTGESSGDLAGFDVAGAGDATGDGNADVFLGAPGVDAGEPLTGAAYLVGGDCPVSEPEEPPAEPTKPTPPQEPGPAFSADVTFDCTQVTVRADAYDTVYLEFADGTAQRFSGDFSGERAFAGTGDAKDKVVRKVIVRSGESVVRASNANYGACPGAGEPTPPAPAPTPGDGGPKEPPNVTPPTNGAPEPSIEFLNCTAVRITGDFESVFLSTGFYDTSGFGTSYLHYGPLNGTTVIDLSDGRGEGFDGRSSIDGVQAYADGLDQAEPTIEKTSPLIDECDLRPAPIDVSFVDYQRIDGGGYEVTFEYTNPNNATLSANSEFVSGVTKDEPPREFEPGTHRFTVTWRPDSPDERLVWEVDLGPFGYDTVSASSPPAGELATTTETTTENATTTETTTENETTTETTTTTTTETTTTTTTDTPTPTTTTTTTTDPGESGDEGGQIVAVEEQDTTTTTESA